MNFSEQQISAYLDDEMTGDQLSEFEAALLTDQDLRDAVEETKELRRQLRELPRFQVSESFAKRVVATALAAQSGADAVDPSDSENAAAASQPEPTNLAHPRQVDGRPWKSVLLVVASMAALVFFAVYLPENVREQAAVDSTSSTDHESGGATAEDTDELYRTAEPTIDGLEIEEESSLHAKIASDKPQETKAVTQPQATGENLIARRKEIVNQPHQFLRSNNPNHNSRSVMRETIAERRRLESELQKQLEKSVRQVGDLAKADTSRESGIEEVYVVKLPASYRSELSQLLLKKQAAVESFNLSRLPGKDARARAKYPGGMAESSLNQDQQGNGKLDKTLLVADMAPTQLAQVLSTLGAATGKSLSSKRMDLDDAVASIVSPVGGFAALRDSEKAKQGVSRGAAENRNGSKGSAFGVGIDSVAQNAVPARTQITPQEADITNANDKLARDISAALRASATNQPVPGAANSEGAAEGPTVGSIPNTPPAAAAPAEALADVSPATPSLELAVEEPAANSGNVDSETLDRDSLTRSMGRKNAFGSDPFAGEGFADDSAEEGDGLELSIEIEDDSPADAADAFGAFGNGAAEQPESPAEPAAEKAKDVDQTTKKSESALAGGGRKLRRVIFVFEDPQGQPAIPSDGAVPAEAAQTGTPE